MKTSEFLGFAARCIDAGLPLDAHLAGSHEQRKRAADYVILTLPQPQDDPTPATHDERVMRFLLAAEIARSEGM